MTKMNRNDAKNNIADAARIKRRSILKAGAVVAPLALTLHGGIPLAHAASSGCLDDLRLHVKVPNFIPDLENSNNGKTVYKWDGEDPVAFAPEQTTGREINGVIETHWDYLKNEEVFGASCLTSIENSGVLEDFYSS